MKKLTLFFLISLALSIALNANAVSFDLTSTPANTTTVDTGPTGTIFTRSLSVGSYGLDVMALNKILSLELKTATNTSATFSTNTSAAIKAFQEKYATDILIPSGLSAGTGFVGPNTIKKLNSLASKYVLKLNDFTLPPRIVSTAKNIFATTLTIGSTGDDVTLLKTILNSDPSTALSPKNSTNIFDVATALAIKRFQEKYASEVLTPAGLKNGTGIVGPATIKKLNSLLNTYLASIGIATSTISGITSTIDSATTSLMTAPVKQIFTVSGSIGGISGSASVNTTDNQIIGSYCDGTTLITNKVGFDSVYKTSTPDSTQCSGGITYNTYNYNMNGFGVCKKTAYTTGTWGDCYKPDISDTANLTTEELTAGAAGNTIQKRTVTAGAVSTTTCPYDDTPPPAFQSCGLPDCPDDQDIAMIGQVETESTCLNGSGLQAYTISNDPAPTFSTHNNKQCRYTHGYVLHFNPLIETFGFTVTHQMQAIIDITTAVARCPLIDRTIYERMLTIGSTIKAFGN